MNILNAFNLSGKTALVTGCNRGIGMGMAVGLAEAGADIITVHLEGSTHLHRTISTIKSYGVKIVDRLK